MEEELLVTWITKLLSIMSLQYNEDYTNDYVSNLN